MELLIFIGIVLLGASLLFLAISLIADKQNKKTNINQYLFDPKKKEVKNNNKNEDYDYWKNEPDFREDNKEFLSNNHEKDYWIDPFTGEKKQDGTNTPIIEHSKIEYLCTEAEKKFYKVLNHILDDSYKIHCQVSLIALVEPKKFKDKKRAYSKRVDFVIANKESKILAVIELDDKTHKRKKRKKRDEYVNNALKGHHPFIRIKTSWNYNSNYIAELLKKEAGIENRMVA